MCTTPLQMLIAEKIIKINREDNFDLIVIALNDNEKYSLYYKRLSRLCISSLYYKTQPGLKGFNNYIKKLKENKLNKNYSNLYLASIDSRHLQYIVSKNYTSNIYTFDDGTANIIPNSIYYSDIEPPKWKKIIWSIMGIKYYMKDIKKISKLHYTLYNNIPNIIDNTFVISLYDNENKKFIKENSINNIIKIYLGQPLCEISNNFTDKYIVRSIENLKIDYYYPHPREKNIPKGNYKIINTPLIFEDYIMVFLKNNPNCKIEIYSFISTATINLVGLNRIVLNYIYDEYLHNNYKEFYEFSEKKFGIMSLEVDS
jgi:beta-galactosamide-alpha-2,3-sialyltransferase